MVKYADFFGSTKQDKFDEVMLSFLNKYLKDS